MIHIKNCDNLEQDLRLSILAVKSEQGLTMYRLAKLSGVAEATIVRFLKGETVTTKTVEKLAMGFNK